MASRNEAKQQKEKTSQALIESALELCAEEGYASLSLRSVARKAGIAPTSFYRHFREIDEMGVAMVEQAKEALDGWLAGARKKMTFPGVKAGDSPEKMLAAIELLTRPFVATFTDCFNANPRLFHLFFQESSGCAPLLRSAITDASDGLIRNLAGILKRSGKAFPGNIDEANMIAETMITIVSRNVMENSSPPNFQLNYPTEPTIQKLNLLLLGALILKQTKQE
ncbi:MAG: TetR family transcriptional regulator [Desulfobacteraceae bacterium]|nr:MAG: TetR family transcriptional regulator [Desulfobacteraceae bacterium]